MALMVMLMVMGGFAGLALPAYRATSAAGRARLAELMASHERNLRSGNPDIVAESKQRWAIMCQFLKDSRHTYKHGVALEEFGRDAERMYR